MKKLIPILFLLLGLTASAQINVTNYPLVTALATNDWMFVSSYGTNQRTRNITVSDLITTLTDLGLGASTNGISTVQTNGGTIVSGSTTLNVASGQGIVVTGGYSGSQVSVTLATSFNPNTLATTNYVVSVGTNSIKLIAGANVTIVTNPGLGIISYTISASGAGNTTNTSTMALNSPVIGQGGNNVATTNANSFRELESIRTAGLETANYGVPQVIWYTGGAGDWEDAASMQLILMLHKEGKINLRGVGLGTGGWRVIGTNDASIEAMSTLFDYYKVNPGQVPMSLYTNTTWGFLPIDGPGSGYTTNGVYPTNTLKLFTWYMTNKAYGKYSIPGAPYETTLRMFRRVLSDADTNSITFAINHPIAPLTELFDSTADQFSPLSGQDLFNSRVRQVTIMAGDYTNCWVTGGEYNISTSTGVAYSNIVARITKPITWIGFSIGVTNRGSDAAFEPNYIKAFKQGWRLLNPANPMYDMTYQTTTTGDSGRSAWGSVHALLIGYGKAAYDTSTSIPLTLYTNAFITTNSVYSSISNTTVDIFRFHNTGTNVILANGSNYWKFTGVNQSQRFLSYINTNYVQWLLDQYNYTTQFDPVVEKFDNSRTNFLGIGTASPADRVHIQMTNAAVTIRSDNNYAKITLGLNPFYSAEIGSQGHDLLFASGRDNNGSFEFYRGPFSDGATALIAHSSTNGGWWFGGFPSDLLDIAPKGEIYAATGIRTPVGMFTNWVDGNYIKITQTNININGNSIDSWNDVTNFFTLSATAFATNAVSGIKTNTVNVQGAGVTNIDFQATTSLTVTGGVSGGTVTIGIPTALAGIVTFGNQLISTASGTNLAVGFSATNNILAVTNTLTVGRSGTTIATTNTLQVNTPALTNTLVVATNGTVYLGSNLFVNASQVFSISNGPNISLTTNGQVVTVSAASGSASNAVVGIKTNTVYVLSTAVTNIDFQATTSLVATGGVSGGTVTIGIPSFPSSSAAALAAFSGETGTGNPVFDTAPTIGSATLNSPLIVGSVTDSSTTLANGVRTYLASNYFALNYASNLFLTSLTPKYFLSMDATTKQVVSTNLTAALLSAAIGGETTGTGSFVRSSGSSQTNAEIIGISLTGYQSVVPLTNNQNLNFAYAKISFSTNANFNITTLNPAANRITEFTITNTSTSWATGTLTTAFTFLDGNGYQDSRSSFTMPPTNVTVMEFSTDAKTNYFAKYLSSAPNLPLNSIGIQTPSAGQTISWDSTLGYTNRDWPLVYEANTNLWVANTSFGIGTNYVISQGAATVGITGVANLPTSTERYGQLVIKATGTVVFTNIAAIKCNDGLTSRTVTNGNVATISLDVVPGVVTNLFIVQTW